MAQRKNNKAIRKLVKVQKNLSNQDSKPKLSRFQKTLIAGTLVISSLIGAGYLIWNNLPRISATPSSVLEQKVIVSFEQAKSNENLRQEYIQQKAISLILNLELQHNTKLVNKVVYDPQYRQLDEVCQEAIKIYSDDPRKVAYFRNNLLGNNYHRIISDSKCLGVTILSTADFAQGEASNIYVPKELFDAELIASEDELLSVLDHELYHTIVNNKGLPLKNDVRAKYDIISFEVTGLSLDLTAAWLEVVAYNSQLENIENGTRKVRPVFRQRLINSYNRQYQIVKSFADVNDDSFDSRFANALIDSLTYHPGPKRN